MEQRDSFRFVGTPVSPCEVPWFDPYLSCTANNELKPWRLKMRKHRTIEEYKEILKAMEEEAKNRPREYSEAHVVSEPQLPETLDGLERHLVNLQTSLNTRTVRDGRDGLISQGPSRNERIRLRREIERTNAAIILEKEELTADAKFIRNLRKQSQGCE
jgi:hypothetical protein